MVHCSWQNLYQYCLTARVILQLMVDGSLLMAEPLSTLFNRWRYSEIYPGTQGF